VLECVINISEGRDVALLDALSISAGPSLRDRHADPSHHRSVFTLINEPEELARDVRSLVAKAFELLDLSRHHGVHPRFGVVDVVPFVALDPAKETEALNLRDATARWIADSFAVPTFLYGPLANAAARTLPEVRRGAFRGLIPDFGPHQASATKGAVAVGTRPVLVAWNLWLHDATLEKAREIARLLRGPYVRSLAFAVGDQVQVSCNLIDVSKVRPSEVYDRVLAALSAGEGISRSEVVGLVPRSLLESEDPARWAQLGLDPGATIEARS
jgi:glutamate formiminotransferase